MQRIISVIPARGGSKGIPQKNIIPVLGKPLIGYTIEQAHATAEIQRVVVSTDNRSIAEVATQYGADVIWRPGEISGDKVSSESALLHVLDYLRDLESYEPDLVVFLQATSPMRRPDDIKNAINTLIQESADSLLSVAPFHGFLWRKTYDGVKSFSYDHLYRPMRQDAPHDFVENGSIYVFKPEILRTYNNRLGGKIALYQMPVLDSFQIDEREDITLIEHLMAARETPRPDLAAIRALVLDFDGVLTDNRVLVDQDGREAVFANRGDGWGIARLKEAGFAVYVISTEKNPVVAARCQKLGIGHLQNQSNKLNALQHFAYENNLDRSQIAYIGNDVNDLDCLRWVGMPIAVADATPEVKVAVKWITTRRGGEGAVREIADLLLELK